VVATMYGSGIDFFLSTKFLNFNICSKIICFFFFLFIYFCWPGIFFTFLIYGFFGLVAEISSISYLAVEYLNLQQIDKFKNVSGQGPDLWSKTRYVAKSLI
jgi:hypothetical protein